MTNSEAIDILQYMRNDVLANSNRDVALVKAIEALKEKESVRFTADQVCDILINHGQHDTQFKLGETIKYSPADVLRILKGRVTESTEQTDTHHSKRYEHKICSNRVTDDHNCWYCVNPKGKACFIEQK